jgi:hypothetical protein
MPELSESQGNDHPDCAGRMLAALDLRDASL